MLDELRHPRHVVARVAVGNEHRDRRLLQDQRRGAGPVALGVKRAVGGIGVEGACVEVPEIEPDERTIRVAGESRCDSWQPVVHAGVDVRDPNVPLLRVARRGGGHRRIQRLDLDCPFQVAFEKLDRAPHPARVVHEPPARHHIARAAGQGEEHRPIPGTGRLGVGRHDPAEDALGLDAVDPDPRPVAQHQRVADAHGTVPDPQRLARKLDPPAQRERERGSRRLVGAAHRGDHGADPILDRRRRFGTRLHDHRHRCGARCRSDGRTGNEERRYGQCADSRTWCIDWHR